MDDTKPQSKLLSFLLLAAPLVWLGFSAGGFFAGTTGIAAAAAAAGLLLWITVAPTPFAAMGLRLGALSSALALFAVWVLASSAWSHAPARALIEFDRALLYLLVVLLFGLCAATIQRRRSLLWGLGAGAVVVCGAGLITRVLPELWPTGPEFKPDRLAYPITYWNALGLLAVMGIVACVHLTSSEREPRTVRVLAASAVPILATTLYFTFSRGPIAVLPLGLLAYVVLGRPRGLGGAALAVLPTTAVALVTAYGADALSGADPTTAGAIAEGRDLAPVLVGCVVAAGLVRLAALPLDVRLARAGARVSPAARRTTALGLVGFVLLVGLGVAIATDAPSWASRQADRFVQGNTIEKSGDQRSRLADVGNNGRLDHWDIALDAFKAEPLTGSGAGTYEQLWARDRPSDLLVVDGHSLYLETMGELGIIGILLILGAVMLLLVGSAHSARGPDRALGAATFAVALVWAIHAGVDWDWESPVVTLPMLALAGAALGSGSARLAPVIAAPGRLPRLLLGIGCLLLAVTPVLIAVSQSRLDDAAAAYRRGDCATALDRAVASAKVLRVRPEPLAILGICDARIGRPDLGLVAVDAALERDPESWQLQYERTLLLAASGQDPRGAARRALVLNPRSALTKDAVERFATSDPAEWRRRAAKAKLPF